MVGLKVPNTSAGLRWTVLFVAVTPLFAGLEDTPYLYTEAARYETKAANGGERFPAGARLMIVSGASAPRALAPGFTASAAASVSFDGRRVLFQGKQKPGEPWQIYETAIGGAPRRVSLGDEDCVRPFYVPDDKFVYSRRAPGGFQLEIAPLAGGAPLRLTYTPGDHLATDVLLDGRVLFEAPHGGSTGRDVWAVYTDGSGVETIRCDHARDRHAGHQLASGDIVFQTGTSLARFTSARAVQLPLTLPNGEYAGPVAELPSGELLVSRRAGANAPWALYRVRANQAQASPVKVLSASKGHAVEPVILRAHAVPPRHPSSLGDRNGANILCLNAYTSRGASIPSGVIRSVRVFARDGAAEVKLGEAPVETDGSFYLNVPSERPIRFELLDKTSSVMRAEKGWFWMRRGEQRVCVGCHAGPERAPENAVPAVLLRTTDPVKLTMPPATGGIPNHSASGGSK